MGVYPKLQSAPLLGSGLICGLTTYLLSCARVTLVTDVYPGSSEKAHTPLEFRTRVSPYLPYLPREEVSNEPDARPPFEPADFEPFLAQELEGAETGWA